MGIASLLWRMSTVVQRIPAKGPLMPKLGLFLTHWGRVTHICVSKLTIIGSDNGLSPGRRQAIIWTNAGILLIWTLGTNFSEILSESHAFSFKKLHLKMSSAKWRPFYLGLNVLNVIIMWSFSTAIRSVLAGSMLLIHEAVWVIRLWCHYSGGRLDVVSRSTFVIHLMAAIC